MDATGIGGTLSWIPDLLSAALSVYESDWAGAGLSTAAAIPFVGLPANAAKVVRAEAALADGARASAMLGRQGEDAIRRATGLVKNTESFVVNGRTRIPDFVLARDPVTGLPSALIESKNVQYFSLTRQVRDYADLVRPAGGRVYVALPRGARVSKPALDAFDDPDNPLFRMDLPE